MKLDDRDIVCQRDFSPLSAAELMAEIELYTDIALNSPLRDSDPEEILGPARALLARAEAAEAEAGQLRDELAAMTERVTFARRSASLAENALETARSRWDEAERREKSIFDSAMGIADQRDTLATRVAELEAASDAQGWRPVTEKPLIAMQYQVVVQHSRQQPAADHMAYYPSSGWTGTDVIYWRPIPPLPAPDANEEPTS